MIRFTFFLVLLSSISVHTWAQVVVDRTNQIQLDFTKPVVATKLPEIEWELPRLEYTNSQENKIDVKAHITSTIPLKSVRLAILQSLDTEPQAYLDITPESPLAASIERSLTLPNGQNYIQIIAENQDGGIVKDNRSIIVGLNALKDAIAINRKDYALLFATDQYDNWNDLVNPIYDSKAIAKETTPSNQCCI